MRGDKLPETPAGGGPRLAAVALVLALATLATYAPVLGAEFLTYDDPKYVTGNPQVLAGLSGDGAVWAFTSIHDANWIPLVWLSLMTDHALWGIDARGYHATNLTLHVLASVLLLLALRRLSGVLWPSAFVAGAFALHPLHVESVAWIAERKDVLSGVFWMATLLGYAHYVERPSPARYAGVLVPFALGLLCKATLVTLPFVLLLLDYWPCDRLRGSGAAGWRARAGRLVLEKLPLLALAGAASAVTYLAQGTGGAIRMQHLTPSMRAANAVLSYPVYLGKAIWPRNLSFFYPHPEPELASAETALAAALLVGLTVAAVALAVRRRAGAPVLVGWLWFLGTLVPMLGLVQVGAQGLADRYMYIPLVGLAIVAAWGVSALARGPRARRLAFVAGVCVLGWWSVETWAQAGHWRSSEQLFEHALRLDPDNYKAHYELGRLVLTQGRYAEAEQHQREAIRIVPVWSDAYLNLGVALLGQERNDEAVKALRRANARSPSSVEARLWLGRALVAAGRYAEAVRKLEALVQQAPPAEGLVAAQILIAAVDEWQQAPRGPLSRARDMARALEAQYPGAFDEILARLDARVTAAATR